jgi:hypothetical protein
MYLFIHYYYYLCSKLLFDTKKKLLWKNQECDGGEKHVPKSWANAGVLLMARAEQESVQEGGFSDSDSIPISTTNY